MQPHTYREVGRATTPASHNRGIKSRARRLLHGAGKDWQSRSSESKGRSLDASERKIHEATTKLDPGMSSMLARSAADSKYHECFYCTKCSRQ